MPTPRESTPVEQAPRPNTHNLLHAVGKKLAARAGSTSAPPPVTKRKRQESPMSKQKRRKTLSSIPRPAAHPRELIRKGWSRSGRKHLPSVKAREIEPIQAQKRPRGRPRRHPIPTSPTQPASSTSNSRSPPSPVSAPPALPSDASLSPARTAKSRAVDDQPRDNHGRFGKKESTNGKFRRRFGPTPALHRTRAQRAEDRAAAQREADASSTSGYGAGSAIKRGRSYEYEHTHAIDTHWQGENAKRVRVSSGSGYAHTQYFTPNPMSFARKKWAPAQPPPPPTHHLRSLGVLTYPDPDLPNARSSSSAPAISSQLSPLPPPPLLAESENFDDEANGGGSDDGDLPVTPENVPGPEPDADAGPEPEDELPFSSSSTKYLPTLWKPSPFAYAARRWASQDGGSRQSEHDREHSQFFRPSWRSEQLLSTPRRGPAATDWGAGIATNVDVGVSNASRTLGASARGGSAGGSIARVEWVQMNGTAGDLSRWDLYRDSASSSEEEVC